MLMASWIPRSARDDTGIAASPIAIGSLALEDRRALLGEGAPRFLGIFGAVQDAAGIRREDHGGLHRAVEGRAHDALADPLHERRDLDDAVAQGARGLLELVRRHEVIE